MGATGDRAGGLEPGADLVHEGTTIAYDVEVRQSWLEQTLGAVGKGIPLSSAMVFPLGETEQVQLTNLGVPHALDVVFAVDNAVTGTALMRAWVGRATGLADTVVELPAGGADGISVDDTIEVR